MKDKYIAPTVEVTGVEMQNSLLASSIALDLSGDVSWTGSFNPENYEIQ